MKSPVAAIARRLPARLRDTWTLRAFGLTKVPMLAFCTPRVLQMDAAGCAICIPLGWRTRNHLRSMYFGALSVGADVAGGFAAMYHIRRSGQPVALVFKDFSAKFLRRAEADVVFTCADGASMGELVARAVASGSRVEAPVRVVATTPSLSGDAAVAEFTLTISLKCRPR